METGIVTHKALWTSLHLDKRLSTKYLWLNSLQAKTSFEEALKCRVRVQKIPQKNRFHSGLCVCHKCLKPNAFMMKRTTICVVCILWQICINFGEKRVCKTNVRVCLQTRKLQYYGAFIVLGQIRQMRQIGHIRQTLSRLYVRGRVSMHRALFKDVKQLV